MLVDGSAAARLGRIRRMFFFGGPSLHYFALALTIGILFGIVWALWVIKQPDGNDRMRYKQQFGSMEIRAGGMP